MELSIFWTVKLQLGTVQYILYLEKHITKNVLYYTTGKTGF